MKFEKELVNTIVDGIQDNKGLKMRRQLKHPRKCHRYQFKRVRSRTHWRKTHGHGRL